jgi:mannose-1-phosphate guanylyltransferase/mannose-6-phosphate isomerase
MKVIILAGGSGTRLWPLSRNRYPKQFIKIQDRSKSLFQETFLRSLLLADLNDIFVVTNKDYKFLVMGSVEELGYDFQEKNILVEPEAKNTLPAVYAGVAEIQRTQEDCVVVFPSDHIIDDQKGFTDLIKASINLTKDSLITFGISPTGPNTGYGYISKGLPKENGFAVKAFKEKPSYENALQYIEHGYLWNAGIFMFNSKIFADEVKKLAPEIFEAFQNSCNLTEAFGRITTPISMDYGILEKSQQVAVVPAEIGWSDLGSFDSFYEVFQKDENNNILSQENVMINSTDNLIESYDNKLITAIGIENLIVIDNRDALLICRKDQSQKVKDVVDILKNKNDLRVEYHVQDYRPWGHYKILEEEKGAFKIKRLTVKPSKKISYQLHHHRSEHWTVVRGMAKVTIDGVERFVRSGESIYMKAGQKHRLENPGKIPLEIIEVQMGEYLEEDDIVRFDDEYGRE